MNSSSISQDKATQYLHGLSELIQAQIEAACADLAQTGELLDEAVDQLNQNFNALGEGLMQGQDGGDSSPLVPHVHSAITGLQFHDLASQLLQRVRQRLEGLSEIAAVAAAMSDDPVPDWDQARQTLIEQQSALEQRLQNRLRQQNLDSGDIELF